MSQQSILTSQQSLAWLGDFRSRQSIFLSRPSLGQKVKRVYVATENLMSRKSCLRLCHDRVYLKS